MVNLKIITLAFFLMQLNISAKEYKIPNTNHGKIAKMWVAMHNSQNKITTKDFITASYSKALLKKIKLPDHITFYHDAAISFGPVDGTPLKIVENSDNRLVIHFAKKGLDYSKEISPENIFVIEIDMRQEEPEKLDRGLGLGALVCFLQPEKKKE